jgi:hypothetical protein
MYDTGVVHIPSFIGAKKEMYLSLNYFHIDARNVQVFPHIFAQNILQTQHPNIENVPSMFAMKFEKISGNIPFLDRSYFFGFDVISHSDEPEKFIQNFNLFSFYITQQSNQTNTFVDVSLNFNLVKTNFPENNFYKGTVEVVVKYYDSAMNSITETKLSPFTIDGIGTDLRNFYSNTDYLKSKFRNAGFYSVVKPLSVLFNVPIVNKFLTEDPGQLRNKHDSTQDKIWIC